MNNEQRREQLYKAIGEIEEDILFDTEKFLLKKREKIYNKEKNTNFHWQTSWIKFTGFAACLTIILLIAFFNKNPDFNNKPKSLSLLPPTWKDISTGNENNNISAKMECMPVKEENAISIKVHINEIKKPKYSMAMFDLSGDHFLSMTSTELLEYFNTSLQPIEIEALFPTLFFQTPPEPGYGIYLSSERGIYYDSNSFCFSNELKQQSLQITLAKAFYPNSGFLNLKQKSLESTEINGRELTLFHYKNEDNNSCYYVEFLQKGTAYYILTENLSQKDFVNCLLRLVDEAPSAVSDHVHTVQGTITSINLSAGKVGIQLDKGQEYTGLTIAVSAKKIKSYAIQDRIEVVYEGEPAIICNLEKQQIISIKTIEQ